MTMTDVVSSSAHSPSAIPADDPTRSLAVARPDDPDLRRVFIGGGLYTILLAGEDTGGRYCLIDMHIPAGGGPPPHRHDFEEMFSLTEGELEFTFRGETTVVRAGETVNVPANAPHSFHNGSGRPARMLCTCAPAGQEEFFLLVGDKADGPSATPPTLTPEERAERGKKAQALAPSYRTEFVMP
jgi:quercetin dioxygenase-like cupin family protein